MDEQINKFITGSFEYNPPILEVSEDSIYKSVDMDRVMEGIICVSEKEGRNIKGTIYSDNDRVILNDRTFSGKINKIKYKVNTKGTFKDEIIEGTFHIVSNGGEKAVNFSFRVEMGSVNSAIGNVSELSQLVELANANYDEAISVITSKRFEKVFLKSDIELITLYKSIMKGKDVRNNFEEFLIAAKLKNRVNISIEYSDRVFTDVNASFKEIIAIERDTWGYSNVSVSCDGSFIKLERREIGSDLFTDNKCYFSYIIDYDKLHFGNNYGVIYFKTISQSISCNITVIKGEQDNQHDNRQKIKKLNYELMALYVKFRINSVDLAEWIRHTKEIIEELRSIDDNDEADAFYRLVLAQSYTMDKLDTKAEWLIDSVKNDLNINDLDIKNLNLYDMENYPLYCYFVYVNTFYNKDGAYLIKGVQYVKECYKNNCDWRILWTLLYMDEEFVRNPSLKLLRIKEQFNKGCISPVLYIEACSVINDHPTLLRVLNNFEMSVLYFGMKYNVFNQKVYKRIAEIMMNTRSDSGKYLRLMMKIYEMYSNDSILERVCKILVNNQCIGSKYIDYYELGIVSEFKIEGLYELYIMSRKFDDMTPLPKMVLIYFKYNNKLSDAYKAYLYANIIANKNKLSEIYQSYQLEISKFVMEKMQSGYIDQCTLIVYKEYFKADILIEKNAQQIAELMSVYRLECTNNKTFNKVIIAYKECDFEQEYPIVNGIAQVSIYTDDAVVLFEDKHSDRFICPYTVQKIYKDDNLMNKCMDFMDSGTIDKNNALLKIGSCDRLLRVYKSSDIIKQMMKLIKTGVINLYYCKKIVSEMLEYFYDIYDENDFMEFVSSIEFEWISDKDIVKLIDIYILYSEYDNAFELIKKHSYSKVNLKRLARLCSNLAQLQNTNNEKSELLVSMCKYIFDKYIYSSDKYDEVILTYLVKNYNGTTDSMIKIWRLVVETDIDTHELEERIIVQTMFVNSYMDILEEIFESYVKNNADKSIIKAYLAYCSHLYFIKNMCVSRTVFEIMESYIEADESLAWICKMALTKYYSELDMLSEQQKKLTAQMIYELTYKNYAFPYFMDMRDKLDDYDIPVEIMDKVMIEYRTNPDNSVIVNYTYDTGKEDECKYYSEHMQNVYDGVFVKKFILFYGECIRYYITEKNTSKSTETTELTKTTELKALISNNDKSDGLRGRYKMLNDIIVSRKEQDYPTFGRQIHNYAVKEHIVRNIFKPL